MRSASLPLYASPWAISAGLHAAAAAALLALLLHSAPVGRRSETVEFKVIKRPVVNKETFSTPLAKPMPKKKAHAVFGLSQRAIVSDEPAGKSTVTVKPGNTVAKPPDQEALKPGEEGTLPSPVDEFLVSQMPVLADEVRIPYPPEARKKGVEGAVVMDILIDAEGRVRETRLVSGPGSGLEEAAMAAVQRFKFKPALVDGKPVTVRIRYAYRFVLER